MNSTFEDEEGTNTMTRKVDFLIFYEHWERELMSVTLLKLELERRGYSVVLCNDPLWAKGYLEQFLLAPTVIIFPWLYRDKNVAEARNYPNDIQKIVNLQWEQVYSANSYNTEWNWIKGEASKANHVAWGETSRRRFLEWGVPEDNIWMPGAIQLDFCNDALSSMFYSKVDLAKKHGLDPQKKWILFVSSFTLPTMDKNIFEFFVSQLSEQLRTFKTAMSDSKSEIISWFTSYLRNHPESIVIYRPHPNELHDQDLLALAEENDQFFFNAKETSNQWIQSCDVVTSWISTAMAEAYSMKKEFALLRPLSLKTSFEPELFMNASKIEHYQQLCEFISDGSNTTVIDTELFRKSYSNEEDRFAYQLLCDSLVALLCSNSSQGYEDTPKLSFCSPLPTGSDILAYWLMVFKEDIDIEGLIGVSDFYKNPLQDGYEQKKRERAIQSRLENCLKANVKEFASLGSSEAGHTIKNTVNNASVPSSSAALVSVIVPVRNAEKYISDCIASITEQSYAKLEIIAIDDGSSDSSNEILDLWAEVDNRITVIHKTSEGINFARRDGVLAAKGDWVTFVDANDMLQTEAIELMLASASKHNADIAVVGYHYYAEEANLSIINQRCANLLDSENSELTLVNITGAENIHEFFVTRYTAPDASTMSFSSASACMKLFSGKVLESLDWDASNFSKYENLPMMRQVYLSTSAITVVKSALYCVRSLPSETTEKPVGIETPDGRTIDIFEFLNEQYCIDEKLILLHSYGLSKTVLWQQVFCYYCHLNEMIMNDSIESVVFERDFFNSVLPNVLSNAIEASGYIDTVAAARAEEPYQNFVRIFSQNLGVRAYIEFYKQFLRTEELLNEAQKATDEALAQLTSERNSLQVELDDLLSIKSSAKKLQSNILRRLGKR